MNTVHEAHYCFFVFPCILKANFSGSQLVVVWYSDHSPLFPHAICSFTDKTGRTTLPGFGYY